MGFFRRPLRIRSSHPVGQRDGQEGALGRGRRAAAGLSVKALINPTWSPEAGMPLEAP